MLKINSAECFPLKICSLMLDSRLAVPESAAVASLMELHVITCDYPKLFVHIVLEILHI